MPLGFGVEDWCRGFRVYRGLGFKVWGLFYKGFKGFGTLAYRVLGVGRVPDKPASSQPPCELRKDSQFATARRRAARFHG